MTPEPHHLIKFDLIARCAILSPALYTCALAWFVPASLTAKLIASGHGYGHTLLILLTACVIVGMLDVLINDLLPERIFLTYFRRRRHLIFNVLAGLFFVQVYAGIGDVVNAEDLLSLAYLSNGLVAAWYSWATSLRATHV